MATSFLVLCNCKMISTVLTFANLRSTVPCSSTVATAQPGEAFFPPPADQIPASAPRSTFSRVSVSFTITFGGMQSVKRTYDTPRYDPHQTVWSQGRYFALNPILFPHGLDNKYVDRRSGKYRCEHLSRQGRFAQSPSVLVFRSLAAISE